MVAVLSRALSAGALAGALSGAAAVLAFLVATAVHPAAGGIDGGEIVGATINYLVLALVLGATSGTALAVPVGAALGLLRGHLAGSVTRARAATALLCLAAVLVLGSVVSALGTAAGYLHLLMGPALVVAPAVGAWRAPRVLGVAATAVPDEADTDVLPPTTDPGRHRRRRT